MIKKILIPCPTYKESFILRKALIDLGIINHSSYKEWFDIWNNFNLNTVYLISQAGRLGYASKAWFYIEHRDYYDDYPKITVEEFVKKYIRTYEN